MKKTMIITMFIVSWIMGMFSRSMTQKWDEEKISDYNRISRYTFYDYEEAVLKNGDEQKLSDIIGEAGVERLPYIIIAYDVHKKDVCRHLLQIYLLYRRDYQKHNTQALIPLRNFVDSVIKEGEEKGYELNVEHLEEFRKDE